MEFFLQSRPFLIHSGMNTIISQLTIVPHFCFQQMEDLYGVHDLSKSELNSTTFILLRNQFKKKSSLLKCTKHLPESCTQLWISIYISHFTEGSVCLLSGLHPSRGWKKYLWCIFKYLIPSSVINTGCTFENGSFFFFCTAKKMTFMIQRLSVCSIRVRQRAEYSEGFFLLDFYTCT